MKSTKIDKTMGRGQTAPVHSFTVNLPENFTECVKEYGQERADHLWRGALLIEARSAFVTYLEKKTDPVTVKAAVAKMAKWAPRSEVGKRGDPVGAIAKKAKALKSPEDIKALRDQLTAMLATDNG
jgi:hypothetical protein